MLAILALLLVSLAFPALDAASALGFGGDKTYLVILQDNQEIRSTGGLMACTGLLTMHNGNIKSLQVFYAESNQTSGFVAVDGPESFTKYFGVHSARLYDSNVQYDFASFAPTMLANYAKLTGRIVDGVIAVDFTALEEILRITGPVSVKGEAVTSRNVAYFVHYYSGMSSGDKPLLTNTLRSLALEIVNAVRDASLPAKLALLNEVRRQMDEKHLFVYVPGDALTRSFAGTSARPSTDFISVIDTNLGSGKADAAIRRAFDYRVELLDDGSAVSTLTLNYTNDCWWDYQVFTTSLVPPRATLISANSTAHFFEGVQQTNGSDLTAFASRLLVPANNTTTVTYRYKVPNVVHGSGVVQRYDLEILKQAGVDEYALSTAVQLPQGTTLVHAENVGTNQIATRDTRVQLLFRMEGDS